MEDFWTADLRDRSIALVGGRTIGLPGIVSSRPSWGDGGNISARLWVTRVDVPKPWPMSAVPAQDSRSKVW